MKNLKKILYILVITLLISCSNKESIIDNSQDSWKAIISVDNPPALKLIEFPTGKILNEDIYSGINGHSLTSAPTKLSQYADFMFLFFPEQFKVEIISYSSFKSLKTIDFINKKPSSVCFPNGSTAYFSFSNDSSVEVFDMTNFTITQNIPVKPYPTIINNSKNQIYITNSLSKTVSVIDTRTNNVEATFDVTDFPEFIDISAEGDKAIIISVGLGKIDSTKTKTAAVATIIDINTRKILTKKEIGVGGLKAIDQIPLGYATTSKVYSYIITKDYLFRYNIKNGSDLARVDNGNYKYIVNNNKRDEVILIRTNSSKQLELITMDPVNYSKKMIKQLPSNFVSIIPY